LGSPLTSRKNKRFRAASIDWTQQIKSKDANNGQKKENSNDKTEEIPTRR
jgi:hypothetical protein